MDERLNTFVTSDGTRLKLRSVREVVVAKRMQVIETQLRAAGLPLDPPTRTIVMLGGKGDAEQVPLTEKTLDVVDDPDESERRHAKWTKYQDALIKLEEAQREERFKTMLALGVEIEGGVPAIETWRDTLEYLAIPVPESPLDLKAYYLLFSGVLTDYDLNVLISQIQMLNAGKAVTGEQVEAFQATLQSEMGEAINTLVRSTEDRLARFRVARASAPTGNADSAGVGNPTG